jgi:hypothetical protein
MKNKILYHNKTGNYNIQISISMSSLRSNPKTIVDYVFISNDKIINVHNTICKWSEERKLFIKPLTNNDGSHENKCGCLVCWLASKSDDELIALGTVHRIPMSTVHDGSNNSCECHQCKVNKSFGLLNWGWSLCNNKCCSYCYGK